MTQKEINELLVDTKVYVAGKSEEIQKKLFSLGCSWCGIEGEVRHTEKPFLFLNKYKKITYGNSMDYFTGHKNREITANEILSLELTKPTYRPFKNQEECWQEMLKHHPFGWVKHKETQIYEDSRYVSNDGIWRYLFNDMYEYYTFADGTPFGIKED